jgi:hypothetical protein
MQDSCQTHLVSCNEFFDQSQCAQQRSEEAPAVLGRCIQWTKFVAWEGVRLTASACGPFGRVVRRKLGYDYWFEAVVLVVA